MAVPVDTFYLLETKDKKYYMIFCHRYGYANWSQTMEEEAFAVDESKVLHIMKQAGQTENPEFKIIGLWEDWYEYDSDKTLSSMLKNNEAYDLKVRLNTNNYFFDLEEVIGVLKIQELQEQTGITYFNVRYLNENFYDLSLVKISDQLKAYNNI